MLQGSSEQVPWMGAPRIGAQKKAAFAINRDAIDGKCQRTDATDQGMERREDLFSGFLMSPDSSH